jgi:hypothetical protein
VKLNVIEFFALLVMGVFGKDGSRLPPSQTA